MTGDHPQRDRSRRASLPWWSPVGRDKWHAKSPAQGKCPAILPHGPTTLRDVEGVSVPTFTFIDEAWVAIHRVTSLSRSDPRIIHRGLRVRGAMHKATTSTGSHRGPGHIVDV